MAYKGCPHCGKTIDVESTNCIHCDKDINGAPRYLCTMCGAQANPVTITKGSFLVELLLWIMMILPGLIYSIWRLASRIKACPSCKNPTLIPLASPVAQAILSKR